jgi:hypothetical protein
MVQALYKSMLSVYKSDSGKLVVSSVALRVSDIGADTPLFPNDSPHGRCFVVIDSNKRTVSVLYSAFVSFW